MLYLFLLTGISYFMEAATQERARLKFGSRYSLNRALRGCTPGSHLVLC